MNEQELRKQRLRWSIVMGVLFILCLILCCVIYALVRYAAG